MRGSIALRTTIATHPRVIALVAATAAGCLALLMAFVWGLVGASTASAVTTTYTVKDLGTLSGGSFTFPNGINDSGQVVGEADGSAGNTRAFLYSESTGMKDLGTLPNGAISEAYAINDSGQVVGYSYTTSTGSQHAFLYSGGQMYDLNSLIPTDSGWELISAYEINNSGQIVGRGRINGQFRAYIATPDTPTLPDSDKDGFADTEDNCPDVANADQADGDSNGVGDACEPPRIRSTSPANNATQLASSANVTATFSEDMDASDTDGDPSTITGTTFKLVKLNSDGTTTKVTATVRYAAATKKAILDPSTNLRAGRTYKATVTTGAQDLQNNALDQNPNVADNQPKNWKFTVK
jgi:probable HAF family extracellular repeat protein